MPRTLSDWDNDVKFPKTVLTFFSSETLPTFEVGTMPKVPSTSQFFCLCGAQNISKSSLARASSDTSRLGESNILPQLLCLGAEVHCQAIKGPHSCPVSSSMHPRRFSAKSGRPSSRVERAVIKAASRGWVAKWLDFFQSTTKSPAPKAVWAAFKSARTTWGMKNANFIATIIDVKYFTYHNAFSK